MPPREATTREFSPPLLPARPKIVAPPDAETRLNAKSGTATQAGRSRDAMENAPHFVVALSALADSTAKSGMRDSSERAVNGAGAAPDANGFGGPVAPNLASPATEAADDAIKPRREDDEGLKARAESRARIPGATGRRAAPAVSENAPQLEFAAPSTRSFRLSVTAPRAYSRAQIRVVLPPQLRSSTFDASASRVVWRGDFTANVAVNVELAVQGARGDETISLFVEQNEGDGKSKVLETQTLALPTAH